MLVSILLRFFAHIASRALHGLDDFRIGTAATEIAGEIVADFTLVGIRMLLEELTGHQHEAGRAEAALEGATVDEGLLNRIERTARRKMLYTVVTLALSTKAAR